jgi:Acyl-CoA reductase (LuxC)
VGAPLDRVIAWLDDLRGVDPSAAGAPLSPAGARWARDAALAGLAPEALRAAAAIEGRPFASAAMVVARTVFTAPIEWAAVLLARGTALSLKVPHDRPALGAWLAETAARRGLPLTATTDRAGIGGAELLVAMGSDASVAALDAVQGPVRKLLFGSRFSVAWLTDLASVDGLAEDAALYDGRGCMSPVAVATPLDAGVVAARLAEAMARAEVRAPRGDISATEAAQIRTRRALARATGAVHEGPGWAVLTAPAAAFVPSPLPRVLAVHSVQDVWAWLAPWSAALSTIGTDDPALSWPGARVCALGAMQRPPLDRLHDGVDWLRATLR